MHKTLTIILPVYNEEAVIDKNTLDVYEFAKKNLKNIDWKIIIADNASKDNTAIIAKSLVSKYKEILYFYIKQKGKGVAVRTAWERYTADVNVFMDVDLATDLSALPQLIETVLFKRADIAVGSRFVKGSQVERTLCRKLFSYTLRLILKFFLGLNVKDAPCGFKAVNRRVVQEVVPKIHNDGWFFDTELLYLAQEMGFTISEIPVKWEERDEDIRKSRVGVLKVAKEYWKEIMRLRRRG